MEVEKPVVVEDKGDIILDESNIIGIQDENRGEEGVLEGAMIKNYEDTNTDSEDDDVSVKNK